MRILFILLNIDEIQILKSERLETKENNYYIEEKLSNYKEMEQLYEEMKEKFQDVCIENEALQNNVESLQSDLNKKAQLEKEWDALLRNIKSKIKILQQENEGFI